MAVKGKRISTVRNLLARNRVKRFNAKKALGILREDKINVSEATTKSYVRHIRIIIEHIKVTDRQIRETEKSISEAIDAMDSKLRTEGTVPTDIEILPDIKIFRSVPSVGPAVLATIIAEAWDLVRHRDTKAL